MVLVLIVGGWLGWMIHRARVQRDAIARIRAAGLTVAYDWEWRDGKPLQPGSSPPWPRWLIDAAGPDVFSNVTSVHFMFESPWVDDDLMTEVAQFRRLEHLSLISTNVTDVGLARIRGLTRLKKLDLSRSRITGAGLAHVAGMVDLEFLGFPPSTVTDEDLVHLAGLTKLKRLVLARSRMTDVGLSHLRNLIWLELLDIQDTKVTNLEAVRDCTRLVYLYAEGCPIDDDGVAAIANFRDLQLLELGRARITDRGVASFANLPRLNSLSLDHTQLTDVGLERLSQTLPLNHLLIYDTMVTDAGLVAMTKLPIMKTCKTLVVAGPKVSLLEIGTLRMTSPSLKIVGPEMYAQQRVARANAGGNP